MSGFDVTFTGLDEALSMLNKEYFSDKINDELQAFAQNVVTDAKELCPVDEGLLANSISSTNYDLGVTIIAAANYAAYVEFGTRAFAAEYVAGLPDAWQDFAAQFKGSAGGTFADFILIIKEWIQRKGIDVSSYEQQYDEESGNVIHKNPLKGKAARAQGEKDLDQAAYLIARKIAIEGTPAQPFLYPAFEANRLLLVQRLKELL